ncbi:MAG: CapA family protein, partial [Lachnospiraceae bacterium]|nr:CapA family protein [Lachnospiraceae bacterium]
MRKNKTVFTAGLLLGALLLFPGCGTADAGTDAMSSASAAIQGQPIVTPVPIESAAESLESTPEPTATPTPTPEPELTLMALGDNLMHMGIVNTGKQKDGTRNYDFLFEDLHDFIDLADVSVINQETIFGGNDLGFSGYPYFNSPTEVGDAIVNAGFDVVLQATNHTLDQKQEGVQHCMNFWAQYPEILMVGLHERYETEDGTLLPAKERIPTIE